MAQTRTSTRLSVLTNLLICHLFVLMGCADDTSTQRISDAQVPSVDQSMLSDRSMLPADATETDGALPDSTLPDSTLPDSTLPDSTLPDSTLPDSTLPDSTLPDGSRLDMDSLPDISSDEVDNDGDGVSEQQGDCDDSDPLRAPGLDEILEDDVDQDCDGHDLHSCTDNGRYEPVIILGWRICVAQSLDNSPVLKSAAQDHLSEDLAYIEQIMPSEVLPILRGVRIWLEEAVPEWPGAVYHPSPQWLMNNGYPPYWARGVQIGNAANYLDWTNTQPAMVLHELSHAWHHQVVGYNEPAIIGAYEAAMNSGIYESVAYAGGGMQRAYATSNVQEYFAELTEAYFWVNDFYPFNRDELEEFDPLGMATIENGWGIVNDQP